MSDAPAEYSLFEAASLATDRVAEKLGADVREGPVLDYLKKTFGGFIYYAAQKLIDRKRKTGVERPVDEVVILSCPRLFNECFAGFSLLDKGLIMPSIVLLRSAFEVATQAVLLTNPNIPVETRERLAREWLSGKRIPPREVRRLSTFTAAQKDLYAKLAGLAHPNVDAIQYQTVPLPSLRGIALAYGGWYCPKLVAQLTCQLLFSELVFLESFYSYYHADLQEQELLWRPETLREVGAASQELGWKELLASFRRVLTDLTERYNSLPDDAAEMAVHFSTVLRPEAES